MQPLEPNTSVTLLQRLGRLRDDPLGWPRFEKVYGPLILDWRRRKGIQKNDALDVTQDVMITFFRQVARFQYDPTRTFRGYLQRLTHAAWCDWVERQRLWRLRSGDSDFPRGFEAIADDDDPADQLESEADHERLEAGDAVGSRKG